MSVRQPDLFYADKHPHRSAPPVRAYRKAEKSTPAAFAWESMASWVRHMHRLFAIESPSSDHYARVRTTARELTVERIRQCRHADDLTRLRSHACSCQFRLALRPRSRFHPRRAR